MARIVVRRGRLTDADDLREARGSFRAGGWSDACRHFEVADQEQPLGSEDLDRLAAAQYLVGRELASTDTWRRAFDVSREQDRLARAARCGFWVGFVLLNRHDLPGGNGWIARVQRVLADLDAIVVEEGYLRYLVALRTIFEGDDGGALAGFEDATQVGVRFGDRDLVTMATLGEGRALIRLGRREEGVACLDEAMVAVTSGEVSAVVAGDSYCTAIDGCHELFDLGRTQRWTEDLTRWCEAQPDLVAFRGQCQLHRAEVLQLRGSWPDALSEVDGALRRPPRPTGQPAVGAVYYQQGELHRLRGQFEQAEAAYAHARRRGRQPQPGLALLQLADGRIAEAQTAIRRALAEADDPTIRCRLLPAAVEILAVAGDHEAARAACNELEATAAAYRSQLLDAVTAQSRGIIRIAADSPQDALPSLRQALEQWHALDVPYEAARVHVLVGLASRAMGDEHEARSEWAVARDMFAMLGARPDLERLDGLLAEDADGGAHGLSKRQLEVLRHIAAGRTNREIADALVISHRTVERHVSDIFTKIDVSSRAAATAYAYERDLV